MEDGCELRGCRRREGRLEAVAVTLPADVNALFASLSGEGGSCGPPASAGNRPRGTIMGVPPWVLRATRGSECSSFRVLVVSVVGAIIVLGYRSGTIWSRLRHRRAGRPRSLRRRSGRHLLVAPTQTGTSPRARRRVRRRVAALCLSPAAGLFGSASVVRRPTTIPVRLFHTGRPMANADEGRLPGRRITEDCS